MPAHLYLLFLLIFSPSSQQTAANNSDLCQMASREGSFGGRLTSLTWEVTAKSETPSSAQQQHNLLIMVDTTGYRVPRRSISRLSMTPAVEGSLYSINAAHLKTFLALVADSARSSSSRPNSSGPLIGYSTFRVSHHGDPSRDKLVAYFQATDLFLRIDFSSNRRAETVYKRQGVPANFALIHDDSLRSADEEPEEKEKAGAGAKKDKEEKGGQDKASHRRPALYAFGIDGADGDDSYRFFPVALSSSRFNSADQREDDQLPLEMAAKLDSTFFGSYYPYLEGGHLHLTPVMPFKRQKGRPPASRRSFASLPRGTVVFETGILYLLDDALGCVYSVEGWHRLDMHASRKIGGGAATMKFKATGTPYERFFVCSSEGEAVTLSARRRPDRCDISARGSSLLAALRHSWPWLLVGGLCLTLLLTIGWFELQWWTARRGSDSGGGFPFSFSAKRRKVKGGLLTSMSIAKAVSADDRFSGISVSKTGPAAVVASISPFKKVKDFQQAVARMANKTKQNSAKQVKSKIKSKVGSKIQSKVASSPVASSLSPKQSSKSKTPLPPDTGDRLRRLLDI